MQDDLREIVKRLGGDIYAGGRAAVIPGPGHSKKDRSLSLRLASDGRILFHSLANDSIADCFEYLGIERGDAKPLDKAEWARQRKLREEEQRREEARDRAFCAATWAQSEPLERSLAEAYLWSRGLIIDDCPDLRFHPAAPRHKPRCEGDDRPPQTPHPAMVALVRDRHGVPLGLHVTYVALDGTGKAFGDRSRLMFGPIRRGAVQLSPPRGGELAVGEGIETCAAYRALTGRPTWSLLATAQFASFELPAGVRKLVIAADGDKGGMSAATALAERMHRRCDVEIDPAPEGQDWADVHGGAHG